MPLSQEIEGDYLNLVSPFCTIKYTPFRETTNTNVLPNILSQVSLGQPLPIVLPSIFINTFFLRSVLISLCLTCPNHLWMFSLLLSCTGATPTNPTKIVTSNLQLPSFITYTSLPQSFSDMLLLGVPTLCSV